MRKSYTLDIIKTNLLDFQLEGGIIIRHGPMRRYMLYHVCLLTEWTVANVTNKWLLSGVDFQMLLEIEPLAIDEKSANRTAFIFRPMVVHV